jgi:hypothetical protein
VSGLWKRQNGRGTLTQINFNLIPNTLGVYFAA